MHNYNLMKFVHHELNDCIKAAFPDVVRLRYVENITDVSIPGHPRKYTQAVIIVFEGGYRKIANVAGDSPFGCIEDVLRVIER